MHIVWLLLPLLLCGQEKFEIGTEEDLDQTEGFDYVYPEDDEWVASTEPQINYITTTLSVIGPVFIGIVKGQSAIMNTAVLHSLLASWRQNQLLGSLVYIRQPTYTYSPEEQTFPNFFERSSEFCQGTMGTNLWFLNDFESRPGEMISVWVTCSVIFAFTLLLYFCPRPSLPHVGHVVFHLMYFPLLIVLFGFLVVPEDLAFLLAVASICFVFIIPLVDYVFPFGLLDFFQNVHEVDSYQYVFVYLLRDIGSAATLQFISANEEQLIVLGIIEATFTVALVMYEPYTRSDLTLYYLCTATGLTNTVCYMLAINDGGAEIASYVWLVSLGMWLMYALIESLSFTVGALLAASPSEVEDILLDSTDKPSFSPYRRTPGRYSKSDPTQLVPHGYAMVVSESGEQKRIPAYP